MSFVLYAVVALIYLVYKFLTYKNDYFEKKGIPYLKPKPLVGSRSDVILRNISMPDMVMKWYKAFPNDKVSGHFEFTSPAYFIRDPKLLKKLAVKDFDNFPDHKNFLGEDVDPLLGRAIFNLQGKKWRDMRATLSPAFTGSKMRQMFELVSKVGDQVARTLKHQIDNGGESTFEMKDLARKFTVDTIATCAFGIEVNSFANPTNDFHRIAAKVANFGSIINSLKFVGYFTVPRLMRALKVRFFDEETTEFFQSAISETMKTREKNGIIRRDMIQLLMDAKKGKLSYDKEEKTVDGFATVEESEVGKTQVKRIWEDDDLTAQCFIFFFAGFDTVSTVMAFLVYELMTNPEAQKKLQAEVDEVNKHLDGKNITYDVVQSMKFMDQCVCEALRKWPAAPIIDRLCVKDFEMEYDDKKYVIEKGIQFFIPIYGVHHDEKFFPDPEKFDPERFSDENKGNIDTDTYIPFGIGPRNCIGSRFALMEIKTIIYYLLLNFTFEVSAKTQIPLKLSTNPNVLQSERGIHVGFKPRK